FERRGEDGVLPGHVLVDGAVVAEAAQHPVRVHRGDALGAGELAVGDGDDRAELLGGGERGHLVQVGGGAHGGQPVELVEQIAHRLVRGADVIGHGGGDVPDA